MEIGKFEGFKMHALSGHIQKIYLAEYPDKILLLDGACRSDAKIIIQFITVELQRNIEDLKLIVVTHMHPDHCGAVPTLRQKTTAKIAANEYVDNWYKGFRGFMQHKLDIGLTWFVVLKTHKPNKAVSHPRMVKPDYFLADNQPLPGFPDWTALYCPGHTSHDTLLYHANAKILYAADTILKINEKFLLPFPVTLPELMDKSLDKLRNLEVNTILTAHGGIIENPNMPEIIDDLKIKLRKEIKGFFKIILPFTRISNCIKRHQIS